MSEVMCIKPHSSGTVSVGQFYVVEESRKLSCCGLEVLDIGVATQARYFKCRCGALYLAGRNRLYAAELFAVCQEEVAVTEQLELDLV